MNTLGLALLWTAARVTLFLVPALALHALASRRGPAAGSTVAALGLALCLGIATVPCLPEPFAPTDRGGQDLTDRGSAAPGEADSTDAKNGTARAPGWRLSKVAGSGVRWLSFDGRPGTGLTLPGFVPRRAGVLAALTLAGVGLGLGHVAIGLYGVALYRRRARPVHDPAILGVRDEMIRLMGLSTTVALRATPELTSPATVGWWHPVILLPDDWPSWDEATRRAVLAHELAHVARRDYATALVARLATAVHFYHPMVHWLERRLILEQEQAADAVAVRFGGGRVVYLLALSRLALRQEERLPCWPARAFLPPRGALIRRIAMLRNESEEMLGASTRRGPWLAAVGLLALALGVALLRSPLRADEGTPRSAEPGPEAATKAPPIDWLYVPEGMDGLVMVRPGAAFRRMGKPELAALVSRTIGLEMAAEFLSDLAGDPRLLLLTAAERPILNLADIEWVTAGVRFGVGHSDDRKEKLHSFMLEGAVIRTAAPFNWMAVLRRCGLELKEIRTDRGRYHRVTTTTAPRFGFPVGIYQPDDRTIVFDSEGRIGRLARLGRPAPPAYLNGAEWQRACSGLLAFAVDNQGGAFARRYDLGRRDDAVVLKLLEGVDHWILGADDTDAIGLRAEVTCRTPEAPGRIAEVIAALVVQGKAALVVAPDVTEPHQVQALRMVKDLLGGVRIDRRPGSLKIHAGGFGSLGDFANVIEPDLREADVKLQEELARVKPRAAENRLKR